MKQGFLPVPVKKHNKLIRTRQNALSVFSAKILQSLIADVQIKQDGFFIYSEISAQSVFDLSDAGGNTYKRIKTCVDELIKCNLTLEYENFKYESYAIFALIRYEKGNIYAHFNPCLYEYFLAKKDFTLYNLLEFKSLKSSYSQRLYEILKSWQNLSQGFKDINLQELHTFLDVPDSLKKNFKNFRIKVLEVAHKDILKNTTFKYSWEAVRIGTGKTSPVKAIRFTFNFSSKIEAQSLSQEEKKAISFEEYLKTAPKNDFLKKLAERKDKKNKSGS